MPVSQAEVQLAKIRVKSEWAKEHILQVEGFAAKVRPNVASLFIDSQGNLSGPDPTRAFHIHMVCSAGDAIHNLRSALDHLAWHLSHWETGEPSEGCAFPIARSLPDYESIKTRKVAGMSPEAQEAIDKLRPYKGGNEPLWMIHYLDIVDKHRQFFVLPYQNLLSGIPFPRPGLAGTVTDQPVHFLGIFAGDLEGEYNSPGQPTCGDLEISQMQPLIPALHELLVFTEDLIQNFKPLLATRKS